MNTGTGYIDRNDEFRKTAEYIFEDDERATHFLIEAGILDKNGELAPHLR